MTTTDSSTQPAVRWLALAFIAVQVIIPAVLLALRGGFLPWDASQPARGFHFSWQMYGSTKTQASFLSVDRHGRKRQVDLESLVSPIESRIIYGPYLVSKICEADPNVVKVVRQTQKKNERFSCD